MYERLPPLYEAGGRLPELPPALLPGDEKLRGALDAPPLLLPRPAQGGRSPGFMRAVCGAAGRFELPNPCGARPESVALPCAFQLRPEAGGLDELLLLSELLGREPFALLLNEPFGCEPLFNEPFGRELLLLNEPLGRAFCCCPIDGGRLDEFC